MPRRILNGKVISHKMNKTAVVQVQRVSRHPVYKKEVIVLKKYAAHDEKNEAKPGDVVKIMETRPLSKTKRWRLVEIIEKAK